MPPIESSKIEAVGYENADLTSPLLEHKMEEIKEI